MSEESRKTGEEKRREKVGEGKESRLTSELQIAKRDAPSFLPSFLLGISAQGGISQARVEFYARQEIHAYFD